MADPTNNSVDDLIEDMIERFAGQATTSQSRAPLYAALSRGIAADADLASILLDAPETQRQPVLLLAVVHFLLLGERHHELATWYPNLTGAPRSPTDPALMPTFTAFIADRRATIGSLLGSRRTQTNEVGRCALFLPAFGMVERELGPIGHLDVGTSGGLNLLIDRYQYRYGTESSPEQTIVGENSPVVIECSLRGDVPIPNRIPTVSARAGIDRAPIDVADPVEATWLEACVWPDQADRFHRLAAAIGLVADDPPVIHAGDAIELLAVGVAEVGSVGHPIVTNSWVLNYFSPEQRLAYLAELDRIGTDGDLTWIFAEAPPLVPELPCEPGPRNPHDTVLAMVRWRDGVRTAQTLASCHPHGYWLHWR